MKDDEDDVIMKKTKLDSYIVYGREIEKLFPYEFRILRSINPAFAVMNILIHFLISPNNYIWSKVVIPKSLNGRSGRPG
jgi:hypothetical protein